eukprot:2341014-Pleurochrysis_carterae.AAC.1
MMKPAFFPDVLDALRLIHHCQRPVVTASDSATTGIASSSAAAAASSSTYAAARSKRSPYKPVAEQPAQPARRQRKTTAAAGLQQRLDDEATNLDDEEEDGGLEAYLAAASARIGQLGGTDGDAAACSPQHEASAETEAEEALQAAKSSFEYRFIDCLQSLIDH